MGRFATEILLDVFNLSWKEGKLPQIWREAIMAPILKRGKDKVCFRSFRSTEDQTTHLAQEIENAFQAKTVTLVTGVDLQRAFDKVWMDVTLVKLQRNGVGGSMYR
ncbi:uncharacterized protein LOC128551940 [Mercenaria mercenaria]|uniref:uncharacterized protein LOC128551940 n=1 Tax=Mercenaria mercenaria TaxID=6596 RepID=UPI00234F9D18|nr:uncharacterized protein LOC128551940 [Mercenaria mercenaria]